MEFIFVARFLVVCQGPPAVARFIIILKDLMKSAEWGGIRAWGDIKAVIVLRGINCLADIKALGMVLELLLWCFYSFEWGWSSSPEPVQRLAFCKQAEAELRGRTKGTAQPKRERDYTKKEREVTLNSLCIQSESQECLWERLSYSYSSACKPRAESTIATNSFKLPCSCCMTSRHSLKWGSQQEEISCCELKIRTPRTWHDYHILHFAPFSHCHEASEETSELEGICGKLICCNGGESE